MDGNLSACLPACSSAQQVLLYGAGAQAERFLTDLQAFQGRLRVHAACVTDTAQNPPQVCGIPVTSLEAQKGRAQHSAVILALPAEKRGQVREQLKSSGFSESIFDMEDVLAALNLTESYRFHNRGEGCGKLCICLAGYKPFLWDDVFERIETFLPDDIHLCVVSSGRYEEALAARCAENGWSYLSVLRNCVTLAQNLALLLFPAARVVFKLDEDIFVTRGFFQALEKTYADRQLRADYDIGIVAPLIPVNGYGHKRILKRLDLEGVYETRFEKPIYASRPQRKIERDASAARFFWGEGGAVPRLDALNARLSAPEGPAYTICPVRLSIGAILFERQLWIDMGLFPVRPGSCMGLDETHLCSYCMVHSKAIVICERIAAGHFGFGAQNQGMREWYGQHPAYFKLPGGAGIQKPDR